MILIITYEIIAIEYIFPLRIIISFSKINAESRIRQVM